MVKIYLSAGHGGTDSGAVARGLKEKDYTLLLALELGKLLQNTYHTVHYARTTDTAKTIDERAKEINKLDVDLVLDLHLNSFSEVSANGVEVWHSIHNTDEFASALSSSISNALGIRNRGAKTKKNEQGRDWYGIIRETVPETVIIECCFISNVSDMEKYSTAKVAKAIYDVIIERFGGEKNEEKQPTNFKDNVLDRIMLENDIALQNFNYNYFDNEQWKTDITLISYCELLYNLINQMNDDEQIKNHLNDEMNEYLYISSKFTLFNVLAVKQALAIANMVKSIVIDLV